MDTLDAYHRAQDGFDEVLTAVPAGEWDAPSECSKWTVRDVAGHVVWGQWQLRAWATGTADPRRDGAPGSPHPAVLAGDDPLAAWRAARTAADEALTAEALARMTTVRGMGEVPVEAMVVLLTTDFLCHTWDIGHAVGQHVRLDPDLLPASFEWARANVLRQPGFFGPELTPPAGADEQTRYLAFVGRSADRGDRPVVAG